MPQPPNIVLIVGDDVGWTDFGFMGSESVRTPHLDRLSTEGTVFTHAMSSASTCKPALRTLLTGLDPATVAIRLQRAAREVDGALVFKEVFETLPKLLAERGYASARRPEVVEHLREDLRNRLREAKAQRAN